MTFPPSKSLRDILIDVRDDAVIALGTQDENSVDHEGELIEAVAQFNLDFYHAVANSLGLLDEASGGSRQHYVDTGAYLLEGEAL